MLCSGSLQREERRSVQMLLTTSVAAEIKHSWGGKQAFEVWEKKTENVS